MITKSAYDRAIDRCPRKPWWGTLAFAIAIFAAGNVPARADEAFDVNQLRGGQYFTAIKLVPSERAATDNTHPIAITATNLKSAMGSLTVDDGPLGDGAAVFSERELESLAAPLSDALSKANARQDVAFAISGKHGVLGDLSPLAVTTGRVFMTATGLNMIFGSIQERFEGLDVSERMKALQPGKRTRTLDSIWRLRPGTGSMATKRSDWVLFDPQKMDGATQSVARAVSAVPSAVPITTPNTPAPARQDTNPNADIKRRLKLLEELKTEGLITEEEYRTRRRTIIDQI